MTHAVIADNVHFSYTSQTENVPIPVFDGLNLTVEEGSFVAVLGRNGCGKSTLAKHLNAIVLPEGGSVRVFDTEIPRSVRAAEASGEGKSIFAFDPKSRVAQAYTNLTKEVAELGKETNRSRSDGAR